MKKEYIYSSLFLGVVIGLCLPVDLLATTVTGPDIPQMGTGVNIVKKILFTYGCPVIGMCGGFYGIMKASMSGTPDPLLIYGLIGICVGVVPTFVDTFYTVSGMLIP